MTCTEIVAVPVAKSATPGFAPFVRSDRLCPFLREVLAAIEVDACMSSYHLRVVPAASFDLAPDHRCFNRRKKIEIDAEMRTLADAAGFYIFVTGDSARKGEPPDDMHAIPFEKPLAFTDKSGKTVTLTVSAKDLCVSDDGKAFRCFLDAQGRAMYVVTRQQFVRRQSELSDEQLQTLWRTALDVVEQQHRAEGGTAPDLFVDIRINSGSFQNIAHLHLKVWMHEPLFEAHWSTNAVYEKLIGEGTITGRHGVRGLQKAA